VTYAVAHWPKVFVSRFGVYLAEILARSSVYSVLGSSPKHQLRNRHNLPRTRRPRGT
jgi:hypothetical protein